MPTMSLGCMMVSPWASGGASGEAAGGLVAAQALLAAASADATVTGASTVGTVAACNKPVMEIATSGECLMPPQKKQRTGNGKCADAPLDTLLKAATTASVSAYENNRAGESSCVLTHAAAL